MSNLIFCGALFLLVYPLLLYPLLLAAFSKKKYYPPIPDSELPSISVLVSVYNEEVVIESKIENFLALDYPAERLELLIISDGSEDLTDALVQACPDPRVRLLRQEGRLGKTSALNWAAREAKGEILFFSDADSMLHQESLRRLVMPFVDVEVGLVSGRSVYCDAEGRETTGSFYRRYEEWIKEREGRLYGIAGADGAIYALRRELYIDLPPAYINDLLHPVQVVLAGKRALARPDALVTEPGGEDSGGEFARQTRIMAQSWLIFLRNALPLIRGGRWGFFWQFVTHKVLRWLALPFLVLAAGSKLWFFIASLAFCILGYAGSQGQGGKAGRIAWLFLLQSVAALNGLWALVRGEHFVTWKPKGR